MISVKKESTTVTLACEKQKDFEPFDALKLTLVPSHESCFLGVAAIGVSEPDSVLSSNQEKILHLVEKFGPATNSQLKQEFGGAESTFNNVLKYLVDRGLVHKQGMGRGATYTVKLDI